LYFGGLKMRAVGVVLALAVLSALAAAEDKAAKPLTPEQAAKKVNERCTVQLEVLSTGKGKGVVFLNSRKDFQAADNFTAFISKEGVKSLKGAKVEDPAAHFKGKRVRVTGTVKLYRDKPQIVVDKAEQIRLVEKE
jgi:DNA/RNA endonuclease YhcR with UshA esterase domain